MTDDQRPLVIHGAMDVETRVIEAALTEVLDEPLGH